MVWVIFTFSMALFIAVFVYSHLTNQSQVFWLNIYYSDWSKYEKNQTDFSWLESHFTCLIHHGICLLRFKIIHKSSKPYNCFMSRVTFYFSTTLFIAAFFYLFQKFSLNLYTRQMFHGSSPLHFFNCFIHRSICSFCFKIFHKISTSNECFMARVTLIFSTALFIVAFFPFI